MPSVLQRPKNTKFTLSYKDQVRKPKKLKALPLASKVPVGDLYLYIYLYASFQKQRSPVYTSNTIYIYRYIDICMCIYIYYLIQEPLTRRPKFFWKPPYGSHIALCRALATHSWTHPGCLELSSQWNSIPFEKRCACVGCSFYLDPQSM